jgi:hypothetical protein
MKIKGITSFNLNFFYLEMKLVHKKLSALYRYLKCGLYALISIDVWEGE